MLEQTVFRSDGSRLEVVNKNASSYFLLEGDKTPTFNSNKPTPTTEPYSVNVKRRTHSKSNSIRLFRSTSYTLSYLQFSLHKVKPTLRKFEVIFNVAVYNEFLKAYSFSSLLVS